MAESSVAGCGVQQAIDIVAVYVAARASPRSSAELGDVGTCDQGWKGDAQWDWTAADDVL